MKTALWIPTVAVWLLFAVELVIGVQAHRSDTQSRISDAFTARDQMTRQNASWVDSNDVATETLRGYVDELLTIMAHFKVGDQPVAQFKSSTLVLGESQ